MKYDREVLIAAYIDSNEWKLDGITRPFARNTDHAILKLKENIPLNHTARRKSELLTIYGPCTGS